MCGSQSHTDLEETAVKKGAMKRVGVCECLKAGAGWLDVANRHRTSHEPHRVCDLHVITTSIVEVGPGNGKVKQT